MDALAEDVAKLAASIPKRVPAARQPEAPPSTSVTSENVPSNVSAGAPPSVKPSAATPSTATPSTAASSTATLPVAASTTAARSSSTVKPERKMTENASGVAARMVLEEQSRTGVLDKEVQHKEAKVRETLQAQYSKVIEEQRQLQSIRAELEKMDAPMRAQVSVLRQNIELVSMKIESIKKDLELKEAAFSVAKKAVDVLEQRKEELVFQLTLNIMQSEKRKEEKLASVMRELDVASNASATFQGF